MFRIVNIINEDNATKTTKTITDCIINYQLNSEQYLKQNRSPNIWSKNIQNEHQRDRTKK